MRLRPLFGVAVLGAFALAPAGQAPRQVLPGSLREEVGQSREIGDTPDSARLFLAVSFKPRGVEALEAFCNDVSNPLSPNYRRFLSPEQVGERFGAAQSDVQAVVKYLASKGMTVSLICPNRMSVLAFSTVAQAEAAFGSQIREFEGPDPAGPGMTRFRSNADEFTLPANIASVVIDVMGIETYTRPQPRQVLNPTTTRVLYNTAPMYNAGIRGTGRRIGISNWDGYRLTNIPLYVNQYGLPVPGGGVGSNIHKVPVGGANGEVVGAGGEGDLDIQMELGIAPLADIYIFDNAGQSNLVGVLTQINTTNPEIVSESYGWNISAATATAAHNQHLSMTAQGITYMAASGDFGTNLEPFSYPNYEPEVLLVGGTIATTNGGGTRITEVGWSGSGGGWSNNAAAFNVLPPWQVGNGVITGVNRRLSPDIGLHSHGGNTGAYAFFFNGALQTGFIGTSFACPVFAGALCLVEQRLASFGLTSRFGRIQDLIYGQNGRTDVWFDILTGNNGNLPNGQPSTCHAGWDSVTGWGAPNLDMFFHSVALVNSVPSSFSIFRGGLISGNVASLGTVNANYLIIQNGITLNGNEFPIDVNFTGTTNVISPFSMVLRFVGSVNLGGLNQRLYLWNVPNGAWEQVDSRAGPLSDTTINVSITSNPGRFVAANGTVRARVTVKEAGPIGSNTWRLRTDQVQWRIVP